MLLIMNTWKILQRRTYDVLSHKHSLVIILLALSTIVLSVIQFGEFWMTWSQEKYEAVFNSFSDNVIGKSLQQKLCQSVPIDVVYTWVNGSDPLLLEQLQSYRDKLPEETSAQCPYKNCVASHLASFRGWIKEGNTHFAWKKVQTQNTNHQMTNWTLLEFTSPKEALDATRSTLEVGKVNVTLHHAHWTTDKEVPNTYPVPNMMIMSGFPTECFGKNKEAVQERITDLLQVELIKIWIDSKKEVIILELLNADTVGTLLKKYQGNVTLAGHTGNISNAFLILDFPLLGDPKDFSPSRFEDKEELRYSLRSLEKFAPWVRHVYLVTNGQIPYWLNLDNPRLTIITHQEIFPNQSHLPTFSSPAIESHLHRIPGLSRKFLYLNDDVMFGREVWPDDFITHANGQKIYFSWSVPDCSDSCPWSWVGDGSCDVSCNTSDCSFDGGDCDPSNEDFIGNDGAFYDHHHNLENINEDFAMGEDSHLFDISRRENLAQNGDDLFANTVTETQQEHDLILRQLETVGVLDALEDDNTVNQHTNKLSNIEALLESTNEERLEEMLVNGNESVIAGTYTSKSTLLNAQIHNHAIEKTGLQSTSPVPLVIKSNTHRINTTKQLNVMGRRLTAYQRDISGAMEKLKIKPDHRILGQNPDNDRLIPLRKVFANQSVKTRSKRQDVNKMKSRSKKYLELLQKRRENGTAAKFIGNKSNGKIKRRDIWGDEVPSKNLHDTEHNVSGNLQKHKSKKLQPYDVHYKAAVSRKPRDTFAESLLYVNQLYNQEFGFEVRKVPAHIPHLIDRDVMQNLQNRFSKQWEQTSAHRIRSPRDMQFAFSYFYFLMSEKENLPLGEIFDIFDTDNSGTWSDREIRTLLTRAYELPLSYQRVVQFEEQVCNCSRLAPPGPEVSTPPFERYQDSKLPVVSKELISNCEPIRSMLHEKFGQLKKYKTEIVKEKHQDVTFKMLNSNLSQLISLLDDVRKEPKKFICLNDNLDPTREKDNTIARAVLQDFYESLFPTPSAFELPPEFRNRFLHMSELQEWRASRSLLRNAVYFCLAVLITFTVVNFFQVECRSFQRRHLYPTRHRCQEV